MKKQAAFHLLRIYTVNIFKIFCSPGETQIILLSGLISSLPFNLLYKTHGFIRIVSKIKKFKIFLPLFSAKSSYSREILSKRFHFIQVLK